MAMGDEQDWMDRVKDFKFRKSEIRVQREQIW
jgi:hypothetical protein